MSYSVLMNGCTEAQLSQNMLESIVNQTNVLTSAQISVGESPTSITSFGDAVYVANYDSNTVSVINPNTNTVIKNIAVGASPTSIYGFGDAVYVANPGSNSISVINPNTNTVIKNISVGDSPTSISGLGNAVYVANTYSNTVSVINITTNTVIKNITVVSPEYIMAFPSADTVYVASFSNTVSVINPFTNTVIKNITVGGYPNFIDIFRNAVYVANCYSNTVSVINPISNTVIKNITVGDCPMFIDGYKNAVYVINQESNTVSVIDWDTNTVIKNIAVGDLPYYIMALPFGDAMYVANYDSNTVSVINTTTNTVTKNITVGDGPYHIMSLPLRNGVYVANYDSNTISVINPLTNEVIAGVTFDISPSRAGQVICNGLDAPINRYLYVSSGTECVAKAMSGYEFDSWVETLDGNSTRTINASTTSDWLVDPVAAFRDEFTDDPAAKLTVNRFGNFTAYFRALPPPVPAEYLATLFTVVVTALVGSLLIPAAVGWIKSKKQTSRLNSFHQRMALVYGDGKVDENDVDQLNIINKNISDSYAAGKITNEQYTNLKNEVSAAYQKIFKKRIESLTDPNTEAISKIRNDIEDAYSDRKITELDYNLLNGKISRMLDNI